MNTPGKSFCSYYCSLTPLQLSKIIPAFKIPFQPPLLCEAIPILHMPPSLDKKRNNEWLFWLITLLGVLLYLSNLHPWGMVLLLLICLLNTIWTGHVPGAMLASECGWLGSFLGVCQSLIGSCCSRAAAACLWGEPSLRAFGFQRTAF